jgi:hypothetical protein
MSCMRGNFNFIGIICGGLYKIGYGTLSHVSIGLYGKMMLCNFLRCIIFGKCLLNYVYLT